MLESSDRVDPAPSIGATDRPFVMASVGLWMLAAGFVAVATLLSPARVSPYLPVQAARLNALLIAGIQIARIALLGGAALAVLTDFVRRIWPPREESPLGAPLIARDFVIAGLLVAVAFCLRVPNVRDSLWFDELGSLMRIVQRGLAVIVAFSADGNNHIGNSILMWVASKFSNQEWVLRLPSLLIGALLPAGVYLLFQRVTSRSIALIAAALIVVQFRMVDFSAEARGYIGHMGCAALASVSFASLLQRWNSRWAVLYLVTATLSTWFVITGAYLVVAQILIAGGLLAYQWIRARQSPAASEAPEFRRYLWSAAAGCWALFCGALIHTLTVPQVLDYSRNFAPSYHSALNWQFYTNALPYLVGVDHHVVSVLLLVAAVAGYWISGSNWKTWVSIIGGPLFLMAAFQLSGNVASPRLFVSAIFPMLVGLTFLVDSQWRRGGMFARSTAVVVLGLLVADSAPVFARYYRVGNPELRQLAARLPPKDVFLANVQAGSNAYYFPESKWEADRDAVVPRLEALSPVPTFVLWGDDCRLGSVPALQQLGYMPAATLNDWTFAEHAANQRRPCFVLYERRTR